MDMGHLSYKTNSHVVILPLTVDWFIACEFGFTQSCLLICFCMVQLTLCSSLGWTPSAECLYSTVCAWKNTSLLLLLFQLSLFWFSFLRFC